MSRPTGVFFGSHPLPEPEGAPSGRLVEHGAETFYAIERAEGLRHFHGLEPWSAGRTNSAFFGGQSHVRAPRRSTPARALRLGAPARLELQLSTGAGARAELPSQTKSVVRIRTTLFASRPPEYDRFVGLRPTGRRRRLLLSRERARRFYTTRGTTPRAARRSRSRGR